MNKSNISNSYERKSISSNDVIPTKTLQDLNMMVSQKLFYIPKELKELLTYMENTTLSNAVDKELLELHEIISNVKSKEDVGERYMTLQEMIDYEKRDSYEDGLKDGLKNGIMATINICKSLNLDSTQTKDKIVEQFSVTEEQADKYLNLYW